MLLCVQVVLRMAAGQFLQASCKPWARAGELPLQIVSKTAGTSININDKQTPRMNKTAKSMDDVPTHAVTRPAEGEFASKV